MTRKSVIFPVMLLVIVMASCHSGNDQENVFDGALPQEPDYNDSSQWYITDRGGAADIFYIISTETGDYTLEGVTYHHADTYKDSLRMPLYGEMLGVDTLLSGKLNYFTPYYRQCSLQSFQEKDREERLAVALSDVRKAFAYYLKNYNQGRPFILAGFSQGAIIMLELMKEMDGKTAQRMVAAYAIGTIVDQETLDKYKNVRAAQGADDTGVTICYNSARDAGASLWGKSAVAINPVNWKTDETPAVLITEPSPLLPVSEQKKDTMTVHIDTASSLLFVEGYDCDDYMMPLIGKEGNYHSREIWLYRDQLRENMALRTERFLSENK